MTDINEIIVQNFQKNVQYLQINHRAIYEKLLAYEHYVSQNNIAENFTLSYENGGFDILNLHSNNYLYQQQSQQLIQIMQESVNFQKNENVFETFKVLPKTPETKGYDFVFDLFEKTKNQELEKIYKFIFFGTGLHINPIAEKINAEFYLIIEDNIELFRLSLFTTKYFELADKAKLLFAIASDKSEFEIITKKFLDEAFYYNQYIKFFESIFHSDDKVKQFHTTVVTQSHLNFFYSSILKQYTQPLQYLQKNYNFINLTAQQLNEYFQNKSVFLIAPGPSLDKNIEFIKEYQDQYIIVALSATLRTLETANIKPDIITHFDGFERSAVHFEKLENKAFIQDSILLFSAKTPQKIVSMFHKEKLFFFESGTNYKQGFGELSAFCAGSSTYLILVALGFKEIFLIGLDLALEQTTLKTHSDAYTYTLDAQQKDDTLSFRDSIIELEGNLRPLVKSTPNFSLSVNAMNEISLGLKQPYQNIYNFNDGAKLQNTIAVSSGSLELQKHSKKSLEELQKLFIRNSAQSLTQKEQKFLSTIAEKTQEKIEILKLFSSEHYATKELFLSALIQLKNDLCLCDEKECEVLSILLEHYLKFVYGFIFDACNTQEFNPNIDEIQLHLTNNLLEILEEFIQHFKESWI
ncbi:6-hydroxymethylpterin diphosphokinase MptE-like protein [Sulfurimonas sp. C5]|uniref:motility associated factor glycosyltransferase family protein n=1 Tax=Sulfurimonas sp. C5 TaxID=3036947 RepID=UPI0024585316|nr:6-hydroxymethylpterin diphosphokinase MptE-like protein [Sulfurimonas sp. C5]MDH4944754.1 DUF115 domain-containing protein [Sulfurimonas sp. C5]